MPVSNTTKSYEKKTFKYFLVVCVKNSTSICKIDSIVSAMPPE